MSLGRKEARVCPRSRLRLRDQVAQFDAIRVAVTIAVLLTFVLIAAQGEADRRIAAIAPPGRATSDRRGRHPLPREICTPTQTPEPPHESAHPSLASVHLD